MGPALSCESWAWRNLCLGVMKFIILLSRGYYRLCDLVVISTNKDLEEVEEPQCYSTLYVAHLYKCVLFTAGVMSERLAVCMVLWSVCHCPGSTGACVFFVQPMSMISVSSPSVSKHLEWLLLGS